MLTARPEVKSICKEYRQSARWEQTLTNGATTQVDEICTGMWQVTFCHLYAWDCVHCVLGHQLYHNKPYNVQVTLQILRATI